ncbi:sensor histidine kinase [Altererythrobacter ishigakiensis]|uniref:histidine kinase n=1 Tax=Altererythrobacter ishigakiensis TaxID=476157 RepID=A0A562UVQ4_9SPHN|nr:histidine kinase dimerization/phospho-acceptor domain-containing protein [Altererythrobacter ishigakiensis]TWJ09695.1 signal transduction histidine kinase [Altererythrobacter ishigakiensis]
MFFDDRLATVLRHRATSERGARTQFRQLLDLLGGRSYGRDSSLLAAAWLRLGALGEQIPAKERARIVREPSWRFRSVHLAAHLAEDEPEVASAALARADLDEDDWLSLIPHLPIRARGFLRNRSDLPEGASRLLDQLGIHDRGLPNPESRAPAKSDESDEIVELDVEAPPLPEPEPEPSNKSDRMPGSPIPRRPAAQAGADEKSVIAATIERIAQFRRDHAPEPASDLSPRLPLGEQTSRPQHEITSFAFESDAQGRIIWAESGVAPMVIGQRIADRRKAETAGSFDPMASAVGQQQPIEHGTRVLEGAAAIRGRWIVDAHPRFSRSGGRFHGYVGRFRRPFDRSKAIGAKSEADRLRQLLHELRTPVNAVQGFAELIHQQLYGPVPNAYRALAATIAGDAANILAGFDELERLAKLESGAISLGGGKTDLVSLLRRTSEQLNHVLAPRMAGIEFAQTQQRSMWVEVDPDEAEAMIWRLLATLAGATVVGEAITAELELENDRAKFWCQLPAQLIAEDDAFIAEVSRQTSEISSGLFGAGFSLRLARAEAKGAGGDLVQDEDRLLLTLPLTAVTGVSADDASDAVSV